MNISKRYSANVDTVGKLFSLTPQRLWRFANELVWWLGNGLQAVSQPPHQRRMSEPRSGEEFPNGINVG